MYYIFYFNTSGMLSIQESSQHNINCIALFRGLRPAVLRTGGVCSAPPPAQVHGEVEEVETEREEAEHLQRARAAPAIPRLVLGARV